MNLASQILAFVTELFTTGSATMTVSTPTETQTADILGEKYVFTETGSGTVTAKKA